MNAAVRIDSPIGLLFLAEDEAGLCAVRLIRERDETSEDASPLLSEAARQIGAYFAGQLRAFDLPLSMHGTDFERQVWAALMRIPYGEIRTYGEIAAELGRPQASRAVGGACARNPLWLVVPCHRVVGASGRLTGYAGGLDNKRALLTLEGWRIDDGRIRFK